MKGGVCKTTLCKEIAFFLTTKLNKSVLVIDIDPQSNCTQSFFEKFKILGYDKEEIITKKSEIPSIEKVFSPGKGNLEGVESKDVIFKLNENLHIIPGELHTIFMERETGSGAAEQRLTNFIDENKIKEEYDYIFVDCPPTYSFYTIAALLASDFYFVPVVPDAYSLLGVNLLEDVVKQLKKSYKTNFMFKPLDNLGVIFTKIPSTLMLTSGMSRNMEQIRQELEDRITCFDNYLIKYDKVISSQLHTFIIDRKDKNMYNNLNKICMEFIVKVESYNGE